MTSFTCKPPETSSPRAGATETEQFPYFRILSLYQGAKEMKLLQNFCHLEDKHEKSSFCYSMFLKILVFQSRKPFFTCKRRSEGSLGVFSHLHHALLQQKLPWRSLNKKWFLFGSQLSFECGSFLWVPAPAPWFFL